MPCPLIQPLQHRGRLAEAEVAFPATQIAGQLLRHCFQTDTPRPSRKLPHLLLETQQGLGGDAPLWFFCVGDAEAEELAFRWPRHRALGFVDLELEPSRNEARDAPLHPLSCPLAANIDVAVVRIPHETVLAPLQLSVKFVEHEVRQQRR